ncbi:MAG: hydroxyethylthiazole kinase [Brevinema sp.]
MRLKKTIELVNEKKPLVLNLTNSVVQNWTANILLAVGASPIMSLDKEDITALSLLADSVNINIGTLNNLFLEGVNACIKVCAKPIVLDPVGAGTVKKRANIALQLIRNATILRGNAAEILSLQGTSGFSRGVDSLCSAKDVNSGYFASHFPGTTVSVSGCDDVIFSGDRKISFAFGNPIMARVTGMGCALSAVTAAFVAVESDPFIASAQASAYYALCGEIACQTTQKPGSFVPAFIDALYAPDWDYIQDRLGDDAKYQGVLI